MDNPTTDIQWRQHVDQRLTKQDGMLTTIGQKLDQHVTFAQDRFDRVEPVVEAMETMQTGIKVIGWIGTKATAIGLFVASIIGAILAWKGYFK